MKFILSFIVALLLETFCFAQEIKTTSPNQQFTLTFGLSIKGEPYYSLSFKNKTVIENSFLGFDIKEIFTNKLLPSLKENLAVTGALKTSYKNTWQPVWGDRKNIVDNHNQLIVQLKQQTSDSLELNIVFRVFDDGVGFRYEFPQQKNLNHFIISQEYSQFNLTNNHNAFWIPGDYNTNEYQPNISTLSNVNAVEKSKEATEIFTRTVISENAVQTPLMLKTNDGLYINIHEAALVNYPAMHLEIDKTEFNLKAHLVPDAVGNKAYLQAPAKSPWRTIIVSDKATDILASTLILNLNEPSAIKNTSWIKPQKMMGVWWEMHVGTGTWDYTTSQEINVNKNLANAKPHGKHSANTRNVKKYIDFASKHGIDGILVEGWNVGWEDWFGKWKENVFDFVTPYPDFNVAELKQYAKKKNVKLIMHHETSASVTNYERYLDTALRFMKNNGYDVVKTGYVGYIIPRGEHHDGQFMVNHYNRVAQKMAEYKIMLDAHEPVRPTGMHRTYPNWLACEAARGMEFNAWSVGNNPNHETILPFTRLMGGPMDYTPGIFELNMSYWDKNKTNTIHTTLAKQLALYVVFCSPLQMAADLPESYEKRLDAFQFIKDVAVDWDESKYLEAEPGEYITIARKAKNKSNWFLGAITNENARTTKIALDFLDANKTYEATIYADAPNASYKANADKYVITKIKVTNKTVLDLVLAAGGGCAISIMAFGK
jgi:hypothetical protein